MTRPSALVSFALALLLAACGGDNGGAEDAGRSPLDGVRDATRDIGAADSGASDAAGTDTGTADTADFDTVLPPDTGGDGGEADVDAGPAPYGAPCDIDRDCAGGLCLPAPDWPGGTCSSPRCSDEIPCGDGADCVLVRGQPRCLAACAGDDACREGYRCRDIGQGGPVCVPDNDSLGRGDGAGCTSSIDCASNLCLLPPDYPGGHCTTYQCRDDDDCSSIDGPTTCVRGISADTQCVRTCETNDDCRDGYICRPNGELASYCDVDVPVIIPPTADNSPLPIECGFAATGGIASIAFEIPDGTRTFGLSAYAADGQPFILGSVTNAAGETAPLTRYLFDSRWPVYAEVFGQGRFPSGLPGGSYTLTLETSSADICILPVPESDPGQFLDLNVYVLGVNGETWETLPDNPDWQRVIDHARTLFAGAGITLRDVRYPPLEGDVSTIIRSDTAVGVVAEAYGQLPSEDADGTLSINVFLARGFAMGGVLGMSPLTGAMGIHGLRWTGLAMTGEYLGAGPLPFSDAADSEQYLAMVLVHEVGHYLGLPHVGEANNVMLPSAGVSHTQWNATQIEIMASNPLTKVEFVDPDGSGEGSGAGD